MCKYCDGHSWENEELIGAISLYEAASASIDGKDGSIRLFVCGDDYGEDSATINYCPMCGRKLVSD